MNLKRKQAFLNFVQHNFQQKTLLYVSMNPSRKSTNFLRHESEKYDNNFIYYFTRILCAGLVIQE